MKPNPVAAAVNSALSSITPSVPTNTEAVLSSQAEPRDDAPTGDMPKSNALVSDRSRVLKEIAERRNAQAVTEGEETVTQTDDNGNEVETAPPDSEIKGADIPTDGAAEPSETVTAEPAKPAEPVKPEETRTIIVDGKPMEVAVSKIMERGTATLQKEVAADARLERANQILAEAQLVAAKGQPSKDVAQPAATARSLEIGKLTAAERVQIIRYGTDEQAAEVQDYIERQQQNQARPEEVLRAAVQAVAPAMAFEEGKKFVVKEYGDLLSDPDLGAIFLQRENAARANKDTRGHVELYTAIGEDLRTKFNRPKPGAEGTAKPIPKPNASTVPTRTMAEKQEAKANAPQLPRLASARLDGDANSPRPPTRQEVIARMGRARGFQQGKNL